MPALASACRMRAAWANAVRHGQPTAAAILIDGASFDHGQDTIAGGDRIAQTLEDDHAATFAADEAIGRGIERLAASIGRHHAPFGEHDARLGHHDHVHAASERLRTVAGPETLASQMNGGER